MTVKQRGSSPQAAAAADAAGSVHLSSPAASGPSAEDPAAESASAAANVPSQPSHAAHGCSLQLVQRAASLPASDSTTDGLHSEIAGEYCMRLVSVEIYIRPHCLQHFRLSLTLVHRTGHTPPCKPASPCRVLSLGMQLPATCSFMTSMLYLRCCSLWLTRRSCPQP